MYTHTAEARYRTTKEDERHPKDAKSCGRVSFSKDERNGPTAQCPARFLVILYDETRGKV
jgi:hypothetical protein